MATPKRFAHELTLPQLVAAVSELLASGYGGISSGRVRDLPDARTVRWYQTLGLVDRPMEFRGRTAVYGGRHLLQLAAIKRLQSSGQALSGIQRRLAGMKDAELARSAGVARKDVDRVVTHVVRARTQAAAAAPVAAPAGASRAQRRRDTAFWKSTPTTTAACALLPPVPRVMQSFQLGDAGMLLWSGRGLTAAEQARLAQLSEPLRTFLQSVHRSSEGVAADDASYASDPARRPKEGVRP